DDGPLALPQRPPERPDVELAVRIHGWHRRRVDAPGLRCAGRRRPFDGRRRQLAGLAPEQHHHRLQLTSYDSNAATFTPDRMTPDYGFRRVNVRDFGGSEGLP